ncbi:PPC domain-containing protein [Leptolyngbya sp. AN03gr2]|uniref:PPC domain-containing protein n=1 Tax=unclassified Leptolyngbya TaxID=2650499 RepID=UPI003D321D35
MVKRTKTYLVSSLMSLGLVLSMALQAIASIEGAAAGLGRSKPAAPSEPAPIQQPDPPAPAPINSGGGSSEPVYSPPVRRGSSGRRTPRPQPQPESRKPTVKPINFVDPHFGVLARGDLVADKRYYHVYYFEGKKNQPVTIRLVGSSDGRLGLTPALFVYAPNSKEIIARRYAGDKTGRNAFVYLRLPEDGTYRIIVTSVKENATGRYSLMMRDDRATYLLDKVSDLTANSPKLTKDNSPYELFEFQGRRDQFINIRVDSVRAEFFPTVFLLNSKGDVITTSRDVNYLFRAMIERTQLPSDDKYYIMVNSSTSDRRGRFRVSVY